MTPIEMLTEQLRSARILAIGAKMDWHFISEIDHLIATAEANKEDAQ